MDLLQVITTGCDSLTATAAPSVTALGLHMCIALATIMLVWFGVQESLASAHGGSGFHMGKFLSFFLLITFAYAMVKFYDSAIPGFGYSIRGFINGGAQSLVVFIGRDSVTTIFSTLHQAEKPLGGAIPKALLSPYYALVYFLVQVILSLLSATIVAILAYAAIGMTVIGLVGPVFIPFLVFNKLDFLFWGWLRAFLGFAFYKVIAAATLTVLSHLYASYLSTIFSLDPVTMVTRLPGLIILVLVNIYILFKVPTMTMTLFSGSHGGHDGGMGLLTFALLRSL
jgi:type IV secretory pathway VirB6-like protein